MNIIRNLEGAFVFTLCVAGAASIAIDAIPPAQAHVPTPVAKSVVPQPGIPVVTVSAKRMTAAEKQQSLAQERTRQGV